MKKILTLLSAVAMLAVSCQKESAIVDGNADNPSAPGRITATFELSKVTYTETEELDLQPAWEVGDKIIGFDDAGKTYTLSVASVSAGTATLSGDVPDGPLHLIYKSGAQASDISAKTLAVDYTAQKGDKTMPAVMFADGTVVDGSCDFLFSNAGAIIGISAVNGVPSGAKITKVTISGDNLSAATVALSGSTLALTVTEKAADAISVDGLNLTVTDANGTLSAPVFIAVPAEAKIAKVSVFVTKEPETMKIPSTAADKKDIDYVEIEAKYDGTNLSTKKWAKWNVGASSETDYGWYFPWAGVEGYIRYADTWQSATAKSIEYSYALSSAKRVIASDYLYVKIQTFEIVGHLFIWENTPYQTNRTSVLNSTRFSKYLGSSYSPRKDPSAIEADASKSTLDPEDDAASANWGGTWRMPTAKELRALINATYMVYDVDEGSYLFAPDASHGAGQFEVVLDAQNKSDALLFFPSAGHGFDNQYTAQGASGTYWTSNLSDPEYYEPYLASSAYFTNVSAQHFHVQQRLLAYTIRPISD